MKLLNKLSLLIGLVIVLAATYANAYPGESITLDSASGNYTITYWDDSTEDARGNPTQPELVETIFVPATKIIPIIKSKFRLRGDELVVYSYNISNGAAAKQSIIGISLEQVGRILKEQNIPFNMGNQSELENAIFANMSALDSPENWSGYIRREQTMIGWGADELELDGIRAGRSKSGFGFLSLALPGVSEARVWGLGVIFGYGGAGPAEDSAIRDELARLQENDFVRRTAAGPTIAVPTPFNASVLLGRIQSHMHTWIASGLLDATFSSQLDRYFHAAIDAYNHNQAKAGKEHIKSLRKMLKREHEDSDHDEDEKTEEKNERKSTRLSIDRLAARVLDFDLKYVLKRSGGEAD